MTEPAVKIEPSHFITSYDATIPGYTFTLPSRLGRMLREVESLYGQRDKSWTLLGIEFSPDGPQTWYPGNCGNIVIQLGEEALNDRRRAYWQLAHECVHLLSPTGKREAPVIEEGLATYFAENWMKEKHEHPGFTKEASYVAARDKVRQLLAIDQDAIRRLREIEPSFKRLTSASFAMAGIAASEDLVTALVSPFQRMSEH